MKQLSESPVLVRAAHLLAGPDKGPNAEVGHGFWPEVECTPPAKQRAANPDNAPARVLCEVLAVLAGAAVLVSAINLLVPG
ncbi:MAG TPA: hypothetical protein VMU08_03380 [Rhizomicrobium sp.]|nr:hypothetical protein [Rhizomicrobium sp.]